MSHIIEASEEEPLGDLAVNLISLAKAHGVPGPEVVTHTRISAFRVGDELYQAWLGQPAKSSASEPEVADKPAKTRKSRKGDK